MNMYNVMSSIFSDKGFKVSEFTIKIEEETVIDISNSEDSIFIEFSSNKPVVIIDKIIKLKVSVERIELHPDNGILVLHRFPDIPFKYEWLNNE